MKIILFNLSIFAIIFSPTILPREIIKISYTLASLDKVNSVVNILHHQWGLPKSMILKNKINFLCRELKSQEDQELLHLCLDEQQEYFNIVYQDQTTLKRLFAKWPMNEKGESHE